MSAPGGYKLNSVDHIIAAKFYGRWTVATDLEFMNKLCNEISKVKTRGTWGFFVDMRQWDMREDVINTMQQVKVDLDRRNQKTECWLITDERQGHFILPLFESLPFSLVRRKEIPPVYDWLKCCGLDTPAALKLIENTLADTDSEN